MSTYGIEIPFVDYCGIIDQPPSADRTRLTIALEPHHLNHLGMAHGGLIATLLDVAMGTAARMKLGCSVMTLSMQTNFIAPGRERLEAEGVVIRAGRSIVYCEATITGADGEVVAKGSGVMKAVAPKPG